MDLTQALDLAPAGEIEDGELGAVVPSQEDEGASDSLDAILFEALSPDGDQGQNAPSVGQEDASDSLDAILLEALAPTETDQSVDNQGVDASEEGTAQFLDSVDLLGQEGGRGGNQSQGGVGTQPDRPLIVTVPVQYDVHGPKATDFNANK